jgi:hypothetical protein
VCGFPAELYTIAKDFAVPITAIAQDVVFEGSKHGQHASHCSACGCGQIECHRVSAVSSFYKYLALSAAELRLPVVIPNPAHSQFIARKSSDPREETLPAARATTAAHGTRQFSPRLPRPGYFETLPFQGHPSGRWLLSGGRGFSPGRRRSHFAVAPQRSRIVTHFCSVRVTHQEFGVPVPKSMT